MIADGAKCHKKLQRTQKCFCAAATTLKELSAGKLSLVAGNAKASPSPNPSGLWAKLPCSPTLSPPACVGGIDGFWKLLKDSISVSLSSQMSEAPNKRLWLHVRSFQWRWEASKDLPNATGHFLNDIFWSDDPRVGRAVESIRRQCFHNIGKLGAPNQTTTKHFGSPEALVLIIEDGCGQSIENSHAKPLHSIQDGF